MVDDYNVDERQESFVYYQVSVAVYSRWLDIYFKGEGGGGLAHTYLFIDHRRVSFFLRI